MKKSAQVVMLPTNEKANVGSIVTRPSDNRMAIVNVLTKDDPQHCIHQHLYILSDEEIKEGDWGISKLNEVVQFKKNYDPSLYKKIIAATDRSLGLVVDQNGCPMQAYSEFLPQIPQSFIEHFVAEYNKGNIITKVLVEYEELLDSNSVNQMMFSGMNIKDATTELNLKINPDNTINIKPIKESWSREEVTTLLYSLLYSLNRDKEGNFDCTKWIEENL